MNIWTPLAQWWMKRQCRNAAYSIHAMQCGSVLDVGAWHGGTVERLKRLGHAAIGCDIYPHTKDTVLADAHCLPFANQSFDVVACSNVVEHLHSPGVAFKEFRRVASRLWLSWTPWYSPFGGHEFSPWHYVGLKSGWAHTLGVNLYKTTVVGTLELLRLSGWTVDSIRARYWPWIPVAKCGLTREWATWNVLITGK